jgi:hypothetical protein
MTTVVADPNDLLRLIGENKPNDRQVARGAMRVQYPLLLMPPTVLVRQMAYVAVTKSVLHRIHEGGFA